MTECVHKSAILSEGICKQLVRRFISQTRGHGVSEKVALRELINVVYAQGHRAGMSSIYKEIFDE